MVIMRNAGLTLFVVLLLATACGARQNAPAVTATAIPSATRRELPPSWTPGGELVTPIAPTATPVVTIVPIAANASLGTLPATWTPAPVQTVTPPPLISPTFDPYNLTLTFAITPTLYVTNAVPPTLSGTGQPPIIPSNATFAPRCDEFKINGYVTTQRMRVGNPALLTWHPVSGATSYHIWLQNPNGQYVFNVETTNVNITLASVLFNTKGTYAWDVVAYFGDAPDCLHLAGLFIAQ